LLIRNSLLPIFITTQKKKIARKNLFESFYPSLYKVSLSLKMPLKKFIKNPHALSGCHTRVKMVEIYPYKVDEKKLPETA
jgi:hypothetical protein